MTLEDTTSGALSAKEAQVFYSNASNAQQILNQRRLKQRIANASVITPTNHEFRQANGPGFIEVNGMNMVPQKFMSTNSPAAFNKTLY